MTDYITSANFKTRHGITVTTNDTRIAEHVTTASRRADQITLRTFGPHSGAATARYFRPLNCDTLWIDDAYEITSVEVDYGDDGTYETTWATTDYETDPENGIGPDGQSGWPTTTLRAVGSYRFPMYSRRRPVKVTAKWGWAAIPDAVKEATYLLANRLFYEVSVPSGNTPPSPDFGLPGSGLRRPYTAEDLLRPYVRTDRSIGIA